MKLVYKLFVTYIILCCNLNASANEKIDSLFEYNFQCFKNQVFHNDINRLSGKPEENNFIYIFRENYSQSNVIFGSVGMDDLGADLNEDINYINQNIKDYNSQNSNSPEIYGLVLIGSKINWYGLKEIVGLRSKNEVLNSLKQKIIRKQNDLLDATGLYYSLEEMEALFISWEKRCFQFLNERKILGYQLSSSPNKSILIEVEELSSFVLDPQTLHEKKNIVFYTKIKSSEGESDNLLIENLILRYNTSSLIFNRSSFEVVNNLDAMITHLIFLLQGSSDFWDSYDAMVPNSELDSHLKIEPIIATRNVSVEKRKLAFSNLLKATEPSGQLGSHIFYDFSVNKLLGLTVNSKQEASDYLDIIDMTNAGSQDQGMKSLYYKYDVLSIANPEGEGVIDEIDSSRMAFVLTIVKMLDVSERLNLNENTLEWFMDNFDNIVPLESDLFTFSNTNCSIQSLGRIDFFGYASIRYDEIIPIKIKGTFNIGTNSFSANSVVNMPAIQAVLYSEINNQTVNSKAEWLAADIGLCFLGMGELKILFTAGNFVKKTFVISDLISSGLGIYAQIADEDQISPELRANINIATILLSLPNLASAIPRIGNVIDNLDNIIDEKLISQSNLPNISNKCKEMARSAIPKFGNVGEYSEEFALSYADEILAVKRINCDFGCKLEAFGCFAKGTKVITNFGSQEISTLNVSDSVLSYNHKINKKEVRYISAIKRQIVATIMMLVMSSGDTLWATPDHPFYSEGRYVNAKELSIGDKLFSLDGTEIFLTQSLSRDTSIEVFNLTVPYNENYYVGKGILVHNTCFLKKIDGYPNLKANLNNLSDELKGKFMENFVDAGDEVLAVLNRAEGVDSWALITAAIKNVSGSTKFAKDAKTLEQVVEMISEGSAFRIKFTNSWQSKLEEALFRNKHLNCSTCDGIFNRGPNMDEFLKDFEFLNLNFNETSEVGKRLHVWSNRRYLKGKDIPISDGHLSEVHQFLYMLRKKGIKEGDINKIDGVFLDDLTTSKKFDIEMINGSPKYYELKNKDFPSMQSLPSSDINQVIGEAGAFSKIENIEDYEWVAYLRRFGDNASSEESTATLKNLWKKAFKEKQSAIFETMNPELKISLFNTVDETLQESLFNNMVNNTNSVLYKFIKVE